MNFRPGQTVRVKSPDEIFSTLDDDGCTDGVPFMEEMLAFCGEDFRVSKSAHKTCDTVGKTGGRWLPNCVHLEDLRCDGSKHGSCQADCLLFFHTSWLDHINRRPSPMTEVDAAHLQRYASLQTSDGETRYRCQATELPLFTTLARWWDPRQYLRDVASGNYAVTHILSVGFKRAIEVLIESGHLRRVFVGLYKALYGKDAMNLRYFAGRIENGRPTPVDDLVLESGDWVEVRSLDEILATLNRAKKNRGMRFDEEMVKFCGGRFRVRARVDRIIDERSGRMIPMKTPCYILDGVVCESRLSDKRMFCPRAIPSYWRSIWLKKVDSTEAVTVTVQNA